MPCSLCPLLNYRSTLYNYISAVGRGNLFGRLYHDYKMNVFKNFLSSRSQSVLGNLSENNFLSLANISNTCRARSLIWITNSNRPRTEG